MTSWSEGYVSDIAYSIGYYREMAPVNLAFTALSLGKSPGPAAAPKRILELGFGMGVGFVLGAAANPDCTYEGCDFNPEHVAHARALAEDSGLENIILREASFQDLANEAREGQHDLDIIQLHGILTWVSADAHRAIVEIARKRLKPGGLLYVSYNCMPGWAQMLPVQRLMREHAKRSAGGSIAKTTAAADMVKGLIASKARFFDANPLIANRVEKFGTMQASYLAHEYLNENWFIFHFADVAEMMGEAKLSYVGSATLAENVDGIAVPEGMRKQVAEAADPIWKETLRDFASNKQFRRDLYARGIIDLNGPETLEALRRTRFTLAIPRDQMKMKVSGPLGDMDLKPEIYNPLADLLAGKTVSFDEVAANLAKIGVNTPGALQALSIMIHAGQVVVMIGEDNADPAPAQRFNRMVVARALRGRMYNFIAAPGARTGLQASGTELFGLGAIYAGQDGLAAVTDHVIATMTRLGMNPIKEGKPITEPVEARAVVANDLMTFLNDKLPLWRRLGVV